MEFESQPCPSATATTPFGTCDMSNTPFYTVRAGISAQEALVQISVLLKCAGEPAYELSDGEVPQRGLVWATLHQIETAKALTDALIQGAARG